MSRRRATVGRITRKAVIVKRTNFLFAKSWTGWRRWTRRWWRVLETVRVESRTRISANRKRNEWTEERIYLRFFYLNTISTNDDDGDHEVMKRRSSSTFISSKQTTLFLSIFLLLSILFLLRVGHSIMIASEKQDSRLNPKRQDSLKLFSFEVLLFARSFNSVL